MTEKKRVMVFIDGSNFYHVLKHKFGNTQLDFQHLIDSIVGSDRELRRVYYYNVPVNAQNQPIKAMNQQKFFNKLRSLPYFELKFGKLVERPGGRLVEKGVDVRIATDMVSMGFKNLYDVAILISGDGDFSEALQAVKDGGKHVEVAFPWDVALSNALRQVCDVFIELKQSDQIIFS